MQIVGFDICALSRGFALWNTSYTVRSELLDTCDSVLLQVFSNLVIIDMLHIDTVPKCQEIVFDAVISVRVVEKIGMIATLVGLKGILPYKSIRFKTLTWVGISITTEPRVSTTLAAFEMQSLSSESNKAPFPSV